MASGPDSQAQGRTGREDLCDCLQRSMIRSEKSNMLNLTRFKVSAALTCNSQHTKKVLMNLIPEGQPGHGNISLMRHPDHNVLENAGDMTFYWVKYPSRPLFRIILTILGSSREIYCH
jgi:hypothetical protein